MAPPQSDPSILPERLLQMPMFLMVRLLHDAFKAAHAAAAEQPLSESPASLRLPHYAILVTLDDFGPASQKEVADRLGFDPSDMVRMIDSLEAIGHLSREKDPVDRRRHALVLTPQGRSALKVRDSFVGKHNNDFFSALTEAERGQLQDFLRRTYESHHPVL